MLPSATFDLRSSGDPLRFLVSLSESPATVVPFTLGRRQAFLLNHPDCIDEVLVHRAREFDKGGGFVRARGLLGHGLLTADHELNRDRRRVVQKAFHRRDVEAHVPVMVGEASRRISQWLPASPIDISSEMRALTLAVAGKCLFGIDLDQWRETIANALARVVSPMDGLRAAVASPAALRRARRELDAVIDAIVDQRRLCGGPRHDLLALLMDAAADGGDEAQALMRDDILTLLLAGHDTVAHALTWSLLLLADHEEVDQRLSAEIAEVLGTRAAGAADIARLGYARAVVAESLRLFPPAWVLVRRALAPCLVGPCAVPAGGLLVASPYAMHRSPRYFSEPLAFQPERWLAAPVIDGQRPRLAYLPFGAGPRSCLGEGFAWLEATSILVSVAQSWRVTRVSSAALEGIAKITLRPAHEAITLTARRTTPAPTP